MANEERLWFDAVLHPHRSLSGRGFVILMAALCAVSFGAGMIFVLNGAWPVLGFFGLDVLAIYVAFRLNYRAGRWLETIRLGERELVVGRLDPAGHYQEWRFQPYWVRVNMVETSPYDNALVLTSHGRSLALGKFLNPAERADLAAALKEALARHHRDVAAPA
ncbi:MAG: DUF2244 domain-containing protein [Alphaproteobacteria bacterium]|nr:MAG: DUF2244 domain-containing protein [Alphaproteobacteria bacterium]